VSQYPGIHHTFLMREIRQLRSLNCDVCVASIRTPDRPPEQLTPEEREEAQQTYFIKAAGPLGAAAAHAKVLISRPTRYAAGLLLAIRLGRWDPRRTLFHLLYFTEAILVGQWMMRKRLTHVHSHFSSTVALLARRLFPITMSITIHGPDEFNDVAGFAMAQKVRDSLFVCAISNFARSQILRTCPAPEWRKIHVVALGVNPDIYTQSQFREAPDPFEVISVGRLAPVKGHAILVEAVDLLRGQGRRVRLRIVGDGPERSNLEREVAARGLSGQVVFEGWLTQEKILALYRGADLFALSSFAEGVPVVLMEAMAMEIPCVAPCIHGIPELIEDGVSGLLVPPASPEKLADAIGQLQDDGGLRRRIGAAGRQRILAQYCLAKNVAALRDVFCQWL